MVKGLETPTPMGRDLCYLKKITVKNFVKKIDFMNEQIKPNSHEITDICPIKTQKRGANEAL